MSQIAPHQNASQARPEGRGAGYSLSAQTAAEPRWSLIMRARSEIKAGLHDDAAALKAKLDRCADMICLDMDSRR